MSCSDYVKKNSWKLITTTLIFLNFIVYSIRSTSTGIALLDLQIQVQETFTVTSRLVTAYSVGYLIGGCSIGFIEGVCHNFLLLAITSILGGISLGFVPQFTQILVIFPLIGISGFMNAISETLSNVALVDIWGTEVGNYMQLLYLFYGIGGLITPILIRPFQLPIPEEAADDPDAYLSFYKPEEVQIQYPYFWITGASIVTGTLFIICYLIHQRSRGSNENKETNEKEGQISEEKISNENESPSKIKISIAVGWVTALCHIGSSMHLILSCFAQAYGVKSVFRMEKKKAALISGLYWLVYCVGKIVFVCLTTLIGEKSLIYSVSSLYFIGIILSFTLANSIEICLWAIPIFYALGFGPLFNCAIADLEKYFHLTGRHTSIIFIGVCIGESIHVPIVGTFLDNWPDIYLYYTGSLSLLFLAGFLVMPLICRVLFKKPENSKIEVLEVDRKISRFGSLIVPVPERRESIMSLAVSSSDNERKKSNA